MKRPKPTQLDIIRTNELAERLAVLVLARSEFVKDMEKPLPYGLGIRREQHGELGEVTLYGCVSDLLKDKESGELDLSKTLDGFVTALAHYGRFDGRMWVPFVADKPTAAPAEHQPSGILNDGGDLERARIQLAGTREGFELEDRVRSSLCAVCNHPLSVHSELGCSQCSHAGRRCGVTTERNGGIAGQSAGP